MHPLDIAAVLIALTALLAYANYRFLKLPMTIGVMLLALLFSLALLGLAHMGISVGIAPQIVEQIDFTQTLMHGMLSVLLFAGALHVDLNDLMQQRGVIGALATAGVVISTVVVATALYYLLPALGAPLPYAWCLVFGALISPTDPIAVLGIMTSIQAPKSLEVKVAGESLFNDGVGVVVFLVLLEIATTGGEANAPSVLTLFAREALGGAVVGLALGVATYALLKTVDNYKVEVLITLGLVLGGYSAANALHTSGPIAIVVAGLFIGNRGRQFAMSETTRKNLDTFWELLDEILNAVLFVMIGLELLVIVWRTELVFAGLATIPVVLLARWVSVGGPVVALGLRRDFTAGTVVAMTWGGLRGGISVALALSLPLGETREMLLAMTYIVVVFSILVQGTTVGAVIRRVAAARN